MSHEQAVTEIVCRLGIIPVDQMRMSVNDWLAVAASLGLDVEHPGT